MLAGWGRRRFTLAPDCLASGRGGVSGLGLFGGSVSGAAAEFEAADVLPKRLRGVAQVRAGGVVCSNIAAFFWGVMSSSLTVLLGCDRPVDCSRAFPTRPSTSAAFFAVSSPKR